MTKDKMNPCPDCGKKMFRVDDTWVACPDRQCSYQDVQPHPDRVEKAFRIGWAVVKEHDPDVPVPCTYREVPEGHPDGEYTWDCPHCGNENQEWSGNQSPMSPFRFSNEVEVRCPACGEDVGIVEPAHMKECSECRVPEGDGSCSDCLDQQRSEGRYEELWDD